MDVLCYHIGNQGGRSFLLHGEWMSCVIILENKEAGVPCSTASALDGAVLVRRTTAVATAPRTVLVATRVMIEPPATGHAVHAGHST